MTHLEVVYDPDKEIAAIVNMDDRCSWGPAMIGPDAGTILQAFLDSVPFDVTVIADYAAIGAFASFLEHMAGATAQTYPTPAESPVGPSGDSGVGEAREAEREAAQDAGAPPDEQPADTDVAGDESPALALVRCFNCEGAGTIEFGDGSPQQQCNVCHGTGKVEMPVAT